MVALGAISPALAQTAETRENSASSVQLDEIVVVAQKRSENLQKVPLAITAVGSEALESRGIESVIDLGDKVPGLTIRKFNGLILPVLRGVGNPSSTAGNEASVAVYADGVYFPRLPSGFLDLNNVERVEILKGPQGTLFGRNSTGGVINIITRDPSHETKVEGSVSYGRFDTFTGKLYATTGLSDTVAIDLSVAGRTDDGFGKNIATGHRYGYTDNFITRSKIVADLETTKISLSGYYSWVKASGNKLG
jgi:iron complex outermembrane receptor protein